jgi:hypothetical protein
MNLDDILVLFLALLLGIVTATIARKKGHSFVVWWLFGTVLFIAALPMILVMQPKADFRGIGIKHCPYCGTVMGTSVMKCPKCRRSQPEIGAATEASWQKIRTADDEVAKWAKRQGLDKEDTT